MPTHPTAHGILTHENQPGRIDHLFRLSLKALIKNEADELLVVKESGRDWWDLPGGGVEHGESIAAALSRELREEVSMTGGFHYGAVSVEDPRYLEAHNLYQTRIILNVRPENFTFRPGDDADEVAFIDPEIFRDSPHVAERAIWDYSRLIAT